MQDNLVLAAGQILQNRFRIVRTVGRGGMGAVYLAEWMEHGVPVAVKELRAEGPEGRFPAAAVNQFRVEAKILAGLDHPNLPRVYAFLEPVDGDSRYYLVMEYVDGRTLDDVLLAAGWLEEARVLDWARQLCDVLGYLHSRRPPVIFRDLKPSNVMVTADEHIMLIDFGIAKFYDFTSTVGTHTSARGLLSPGYAAPEQYGGGTDARSDIYSLGATMYCLLTREIPPDAVDVATGRVRPVDVELARPDVSERTARAIERMMAVDRSRRPPDVEGVMRALGFIEDAPLDRPTGAYGRADLPEHHPQARAPQREAARPAADAPARLGDRVPGRSDAQMPARLADRVPASPSAARAARAVDLGQPTTLARSGPTTIARREAALARAEQRRPASGAGLVVAGLALALLLAVGGFLWRGRSAPTAPPRAAGGATATLNLTSDPSGARVFLDGQETGVTPEMLSGVPPGPHEVRLERDDSIAAKQVVQLQAGDTQNLHIAMQRRNPSAAQSAGPSLTPAASPKTASVAAASPSPRPRVVLASPRPAPRKTIDVPAPVVKQTTDVPAPTPTPAAQSTGSGRPPVGVVPPRLRPPSASELIVPGKGIGDLVLGMPEQAARSLEPVLDSQFEGQPLVVLRRSGLAFVPEDGHVGRIVVAPFNPDTVGAMIRFATSGNIRLGTRERAIVNEFGPVTKLDDMGDHAEWSYPEKGISFLVAGGIVRVIELMPMK